MAAPRDASYTPKSGPLAGRTFVGTPGTTQAYNRYQQARAQVLGFANYNEQRAAQRSNTFRALLGQEYHLTGQKNVPVKRREELLRAFGQFRGKETVVVKGKRRTRFALQVDPTDHRRGGSLDRYLIAIGRRVGNEAWLPGETP